MLVVCALQAARLRSQTWLTDCPEITIFPRLRIFNAWKTFPIIRLCRTCQATIRRPLIPTCRQAVRRCDARASGIVITEEELLNLREETACCLTAAFLPLLFSRSFRTADSPSRRGRADLRAASPTCSTVVSGPTPPRRGPRPQPPPAWINWYVSKHRDNRRSSPPLKR